MLKQIKITPNKINNFEFVKINSLEVICFDGDYTFKDNLLTLEDNFIGMVKLYCFRKYYDYINNFTLTYFDNTSFINNYLKDKDVDLEIIIHDGFTEKLNTKRIMGKFENLKDLVNYIKSQLSYNEYLNDESYKSIYQQLKA